MASTSSEAQSKAIRTELDRILGSPLFAQAKRQRRFLQFIVTETLAGRADRISAYALGIGVFDRDHSFDPMLNPIVRVEAQRLRSKLREYYDGEGRFDPIRIGLDKGSYAATIGEDGFAFTGSSSCRPMMEKPTLLVLPFASNGHSPRHNNFADGLTENLITDLSKLPNLFLVSRHVSFACKRTQQPSETIARRLGVRYLLKGSVRYATSRKIRISAQLVHAVSGQVLWGARYDHTLGDDFAVQDEVTRNIMRAIRLRVTPQRAAPTPRKPLLPEIALLLWGNYMVLVQDLGLLDIVGLSA